jgi:hypothetical protein
MENSQSPKFNKLFNTQTEIIGFITKTLTQNLSLETIDLNFLKVNIDMLVVKDPTNEFYYTLLKEVKKLQPTNNKEETKKEIKPEIEPDTTPNEKVKQTKTKKEDNEIDIKIKKLEAKNTKGSYCGKDIEEIERLYKIKNRDREDKFKKNWKNGKVVETIEQKELLKKYKELEKKRWVQGDWIGNEIRDEEISELRKKLEFPKSIFVEDKEYTVYRYSEKHSYNEYRCILISETDLYRKILPIEKILTHFDEQQSSHYKFEYPVIIREDKIIKYHKSRYFTPVEYYREDTDYTVCN